MYLCVSGYLVVYVSLIVCECVRRMWVRECACLCVCVIVYVSVCVPMYVSVSVCGDRSGHFGVPFFSEIPCVKTWSSQESEIKHCVSGFWNSMADSANTHGAHCHWPSVWCVVRCSRVLPPFIFPLSLPQSTCHPRLIDRVPEGPCQAESCASVGWCQLISNTGLGSQL